MGYMIIEDVVIWRKLVKFEVGSLTMMRLRVMA